MENLIYAYLDAYNRREVPALLDLLTEDVQFEHVSNTSEIISLTSKKDFAVLAHQSAQVFTTRRQVIRSLLIQGDRAAVEIDYEATVAQDLPNGLKAGQQLKLRGVSFFEQRAGKISRIIDYS